MLYLFYDFNGEMNILCLFTATATHFIFFI